MRELTLKNERKKKIILGRVGKFVHWGLGESVALLFLFLGVVLVLWLWRKMHLSFRDA